MASFGAPRLPPSLLDLDREVTGRGGSLFQVDVDGARQRLAAAIAGRRVLAVGAAGSIGSESLVELLALGPAGVTVLDASENGLAELVRRVRSSPALHAAPLEALPLDYGSPLALRVVREANPFELVLVFAALKHVRSERDAASTLRLLEVNLLAADRFLGCARRAGHGHGGVFFVSTDKAVSPASVMGASKRAMEGLLWAHADPTSPASLVDGGDAPPLTRVTTARFANVLWSAGSLTAAFLQRLAHRQALAAPADVQRWLLTPREAGQLCLLAAACAPHRHVLVPDLTACPPLALSSVAERVLHAHGLTPAIYEDEARARAAIEEELARGRYPLLITRTDTPGEKAREEMLASGEQPRAAGFAAAQVVEARPLDRGRLTALLQVVDRAARGEEAPARAELLAALQAAVPELQHQAGVGGLDAKM